jgi:hypothetical protein
MAVATHRGRMTASEIERHDDLRVLLPFLLKMKNRGQSAPASFACSVFLLVRLAFRFLQIGIRRSFCRFLFCLDVCVRRERLN